MTALVAVAGDSQADWVAGYGVRPAKMWPYLLGELLAGQFPSVSGPQSVRNFAGAGETTLHNLNRCDIMQMWEAPDLAILYTGVNDPAYSITQANTQANIQAMLKSLKYGAVGEGKGGWRLCLLFTGTPTGGAFTFSVTIAGATVTTANQTYSSSYTAAALQTAIRGLSNVGGSNATVTGPNGGPFTVILAQTLGLNYASVDGTGLTGGTSPAACLRVGPVVPTVAALPPLGKLGQRYVVLNDNSSSGGAPAWRAQDHTTITGAGSGAQTVWEFRYDQAGERGWGRVATNATAPFAGCCQRIVVTSTNYLNFTTGGDTPTSPFTSYANVRAAQRAAVTAENVAVGGKPSVVYADLYDFQKARIVAGTDPDFSTVSYDQSQSWHVAQNNQHHNAYGQQLVSAVNLNAITSAGWLPDLALL